MGLLGNGSVSDYVLHNVGVPVLGVHWVGMGADEAADSAPAAAGAEVNEESHGLKVDGCVRVCVCARAYVCLCCLGTCVGGMG